MSFTPSHLILFFSCLTSFNLRPQLDIRRIFSSTNIHICSKIYPDAFVKCITKSDLDTCGRSVNTNSLCFTLARCKGARKVYLSLPWDFKKKKKPCILFKILLTSFYLMSKIRKLFKVDRFWHQLAFTGRQFYTFP